jgi:lysophospholipase L1-like esterase
MPYLSAMRKIFLLLAGCIGMLLLHAQERSEPFHTEIAAFKQQDSIRMPAKRAILFVGSSSFTKWKDIHDYFPGYPLINRGFGGSSLTDVIRYANDVISPYDPKQIIIYCGENDIAANASASTVLERFKELFAIIRTRFKTIPVYFIYVKPSPSRWKYEQVIVEANRLVKQFLSKQTQVGFIDIHQDMLHADGSVRDELFIEDRLHMNAKGYAIWQKKIAPVLLANH